MLACDSSQSHQKLGVSAFFVSFTWCHLVRSTCNALVACPTAAWSSWKWSLESVVTLLDCFLKACQPRTEQNQNYGT